MDTRSIRKALTLLAAALLSACAGINPYKSETASGSPVVVVPVPPPGEAEPSLTGPGTAPDEPGVVVPPAPSVPQPGPAAAHLLAQAQALSARRDFDAAAAQIERALRIERNNPWVYLALADVRLAQGETSQAATLTRKARSLSRGDPDVLREVDALSLRNPDVRPGG